MTDPRPPERPESARHITLTSHPRPGRSKPPPIRWGAATPAARGPVIGTLGNPSRRNVIGAHSGSYALYRALAIAAGSLDALHRPDLTNTAPAEPIGPHAPWADPAKIVSLDPWGHIVGEAFAEQLAQGWDIRPTIAVTKARLTVPELQHAVRLRGARGRRPDRQRERGGQLHQGGDRAGLVPAGCGRTLRRRGDEPAAAPVRADRRHVP